MNKKGIKIKSKISKILFIVWLGFLSLVLQSCSGQKESNTHRWVYAFGSTCESDEGLARLKQIADTAAAHGLNGFVLPGRLDRIDNRPPDYLKRLKELNTYLKERNMELIPAIMSFSWGDAIYENDRNLTTGLPVKDALFTVKNGRARITPELNVQIQNSGFENYDGKILKNWSRGYGADSVLSLDKKNAVEGRNCICVKINHNFPNASPLLSQKIAVHPKRLYKISFSIALKKLVKNLWGVFPVQVIGTDGRQLHFQLPEIPDDGEWHSFSIGFNSLNYDTVTIVISSPMSREVEYLVDDLSIKEMGVINILRRPGTPLTIRGGDDNGIVYTEGKDYARVIDPFRIASSWNETIDFRFDHPDPPIEILPNSRIKEDEKLRVSWYHPLYIYGGAFPMCMSEPKVYDLLQKKVRLLHDAIAPQNYLISIEEVRGGNTCAACKERNLTMGEMIGTTVHKCQEILKEVNPDAQFFMWGDLFDPNHNGGEREGKYYFHVDGNFLGSWNHIPKDITIIPWWDEIIVESLRHFQSLGYKTIISCYYDHDEAVAGQKEMMKIAQKYNCNVGFMYSTWENNFDKLGKFGDMLRTGFSDKNK